MCALFRLPSGLLLRSRIGVWVWAIWTSWPFLGELVLLLSLSHIPVVLGADLCLKGTATAARTHDSQRQRRSMASSSQRSMQVVAETVEANRGCLHAAGSWLDAACMARLDAWRGSMQRAWRRMAQLEKCPCTRMPHDQLARTLPLSYMPPLARAQEPSRT